VELLEEALRKHGSSIPRIATEGDDADADERVLGALRPILPALASIRETVEKTLEAPFAAYKNFPGDQELEERIAADVLGEIDLMRARLLGKESELFSAIDRLRSEAEFRLALAPALLGVVAALAWRATWWSAVIAAVSALVLALQGRQRMRNSNDTLLEALRIGRAHAPTLDRLDAVIEQLEKSPVMSQQTRPTEAAASPSAPI
jgi:hypothetical protein